MATKAQLEASGRAIAKEISDIQNDEKMTGAEKSLALDGIQEEWEAHTKSVAASERASEMAAKLQEGTELKNEDGEVIPSRFVDHPFTPANRAAAAKAIVESKGAKKLFEHGSAPEGFDHAVKVELKDATAANNLMGDFLAGASGPTAVGSNVFGSVGTFAPGIIPTFLPGILQNLFYDLTIADLFASRAVDVPTISYLLESTYNPQAVRTAEGGGYPFSSVSFSRAYEQVGKITNAMTLTDEAIADAHELFTFAQGRLMENLRREEEVELLAGGGVPGVNGLLNRAANFTASSSASLFGATSYTGSNVQFPPSGSVTAAGAQPLTISSLAYGRKVTGSGGLYPTFGPIAENLFDAFTDIQLAIYQTPNAILMNPRDWPTLRLAKDSNGQYMGGSFFGTNYGNGASTPKSLWGVPVITTPLVPQYSLLVGYFAPEIAQVLRRSGQTFQMVNTNGTDFVNGKVTMRTEERLGLVVYRPAAFQLVKLANS